MISNVLCQLWLISFGHIAQKIAYAFVIITTFGALHVVFHHESKIVIDFDMLLRDTSAARDASVETVGRAADKTIDTRPLRSIASSKTFPLV